MSELVTLARPYAQALFAVADQDDTTVVWRQYLDNFAIIADDQSVQKILLNPNVTRATRLKCFTELVAEVPTPLYRCLQLLGSKDRLNILPQIATLFASLCDQKNQKIAAVLTVSQAVGPAFLARLQQNLSQRYQAEVLIDVRIDPLLVGGGTIKIRDDVLDVSLRTLLNRLLQTLIT